MFLKTSANENRQFSTFFNVIILKQTKKKVLQKNQQQKAKILPCIFE